MTRLSINIVKVSIRRAKLIETLNKIKVHFSVLTYVLESTATSLYLESEDIINTVLRLGLLFKQIKLFPIPTKVCKRVLTKTE